MVFTSESTIPFPRAQVYTAYRDHLSDIAAYIPDIKQILVKRREEVPGGVKLHNEWRSDREIPSFVARFVDPDALVWDDYAEWRDGEHLVAWRIETRAFREAVSCRGTNAFYDAAGGGTRVVLSGDLGIDVTKVRGVPKLFGRVGPQVEAFVVSLIKPNLEEVNRSIGRYLAASVGAPRG